MLARPQMLCIKCLLSCLIKLVSMAVDHNNLNSLFSFICFAILGSLAYFSSFRFAYIIEIVRAKRVFYGGKY